MSRSGWVEDWVILAVVILVAVVGFGCAGVTGPDAPASASLLSPSGAWRLRSVEGWRDPLGTDGAMADEYWVGVQACLGLRASLRGFGLVLHPPLTDGQGQRYLLAPGGVPEGGWTDPAEIHVLGDGVRDRQSWKHEMMHVLLRAATGDVDVGHVYGGGKSPGDYVSPTWFRCTAY